MRLPYPIQLSRAADLLLEPTIDPEFREGIRWLRRSRPLYNKPKVAIGILIMCTFVSQDVSVTVMKLNSRPLLRVAMEFCIMSFSSVVIISLSLSKVSIVFCVLSVSLSKPFNQLSEITRDITRSSSSMLHSCLCVNSELSSLRIQILSCSFSSVKHSLSFPQFAGHVLYLSPNYLSHFS